MSAQPVFSHRRVVRFGECDPAGVVYYPVFFGWFHEAMEAWFAERVGVPYATVLEEIGFPAVRTEADFSRPCRNGDEVTVDVVVEKMGSRSLTFAFTVRGAGEGEDVRARGKTVCVGIAAAADGFTFSSATIPAALRDQIAGAT
ncbi:MAG: 4-hydroxybenzoyl-CoA thioesterase [Myxococcota bacterium]|jgi:4-hydroxybenzoyl-CoA thioesterase